MKKHLLAITIFTINFNLNAQLCLTPSNDSPHSVGTNPFSITSADYNSDGISDLVVVNSGSANLSLLLGTGSGSFATSVYIAPVNSPQAVTSADFNTDGKIDLAVAYYNNNVSILLGNGSGSFAPPISFSVGTTPQAITSGDFNADGNTDLAVANRNSSNVSVLLGIGTGSFSNAVNYTTGSLPYSVISSDFNSDGKADLAVANFSGNDVSVLIGNGNGSFAPAVNFGVGSGAVSVTSADFNADGKVDLATANYNNNSVSVLIGSGTGSFATAVNFSVGPIPSSITSGDFNSDGIADLATANYNNNTVSVLQSQGIGSFATAINYTVGSYPYSILSSDLNSDGKADLAVTNFNGNNVSILLNGPSISINASSTVLCEGDSVILSAIGATTYTWSGAVINGVAFHPPTGNSTYTVFGTNTLGCSNTATQSIIVNTLPSLIISANSSSICIGDSIILNVIGAASYSWQPGNLNGSLITVKPNSNITYSVTGTDINSCTNLSTKSVIVNALPNIIAITNNTLLCSGQTATLSASGANSYQWNTNATSSYITITPSITTNYTVQGFDTNGCSNIATITQTVSSCTGIDNYQLINSNLLFNIYPNPAVNELTIDCKYYNSELNIEILNILGEQVYSSILNNSKTIIDISQLPRNIYTLRFSSDNFTTYQKFVKE